MSNKPKLKGVYVEWVDSAGSGGWHKAHQLNDGGIARCATAGFLVRENKEELVLALNASADGMCSPFGELMHIPKCCITKRKKMK